MFCVLNRNGYETVLIKKRNNQSGNADGSTWDKETLLNIYDFFSHKLTFNGKGTICIANNSIDRFIVDRLYKETKCFALEEDVFLKSYSKCKKIKIRIQTAESTTFF